MKLLSKEEILTFLNKNGANEIELSELISEYNGYFKIYKNTDPYIDSNYLGYAIVKCKEGFLSLPIEQFDYYNSYEHYNLTEAKIIGKDVVERYYEEFEKQLGSFKNFILK